MIIIILAIIVSCAVICFLRAGRSDMSEWYAAGGISYCISALVVIIIYASSFSGALNAAAARPALVAAMNAAPRTANEDVYGKVADFNIELARNQYWRGVLVVRWLMSAQWDRIEPIPFHEAK